MSRSGRPLSHPLGKDTRYKFRGGELSWWSPLTRTRDSKDPESLTFTLGSKDRLGPFGNPGMETRGTPISGGQQDQ